MSFGQIVTVVFVIFIGYLTFGDKIEKLYDSQDDLTFKLSDVPYTTELFNIMEETEKKSLLQEIGNLCVSKHHADKINCTDTGYWLANNMTDEGIANDLIIELIPTCTQACKTQKALPSVEVKEEKKPKSSGKYGGATKWFWEE